MSRRRRHTALQQRRTYNKNSHRAPPSLQRSRATTTLFSTRPQRHPAAIGPTARVHTLGALCELAVYRSCMPCLPAPRPLPSPPPHSSIPSLEGRTGKRQELDRSESREKQGLVPIIITFPFLQRTGYANVNEHLVVPTRHHRVHTSSTHYMHSRRCYGITCAGRPREGRSVPFPPNQRSILYKLGQQRHVSGMLRRHAPPASSRIIPRATLPPVHCTPPDGNPPCSAHELRVKRPPF